MINDKQLSISAAGSRKATSWPSQTLWWSDFIKKLAQPVKSLETLAEYNRLSKAKQDELKDVGGFVGGVLRDGRRLEKNIISRDVITLDLDNIPSGDTDKVLLAVKNLGCAYAIYSTRKHEAIKPRLRILFPLNRSTNCEEYEPAARKMAEMISMEWCDPTTFQASRLMYWPSISRDSQYIFTYEDKPFLDVDAVLRMYKDWRNHAEWPQVPGIAQSQKKLADKQEDPTTKKGLVGAFCKTYDVLQAIETFIPDAYLPTEDESRYTYSKGSTFGGAVIYGDGLFIFSHHGTDPAGGKLCNAFDLVRLHKFHELDYDAKDGTPTNKLPSYQAMAELAVQDDTVVTLLNKERYENANTDFSRPLEDPADWFRKLSTSPITGTPAKTVDNILIILEHDPLLAGKVYYDLFSNRSVIEGALPWSPSDKARQWEDTDDSGLRHYMEKTYGITGKDKIKDAMAICISRHERHAIKDYLKNLRWDGIPRVDSLLTDYLGAHDKPYTRAVIRKSLTAAVARAMTPGVKFDTMAIFAGPQGIGKSTFLRFLGRDWYSDSLITCEGKEASELIQGVWINEMGELNGLSKSETNSVKQFLSRTEDIFRVPFSTHTKRFPRNCVFFGTTNDTEFLKDRTGNRRFWPVDVGVLPAAKCVFSQLPVEVDQIWAEAVVYWSMGEPLYLMGVEAEEALAEQENHRETSVKEGLIREFINKKVPADWHNRTAEQRQAYWSFEHQAYSGELARRDRICALEVWVECLKGDIKHMKRYEALEINGILGSFDGLERIKSNYRFGPYGHQKGYKIL